MAGVACATTVAAYVFIGLDEVGMEIENVFQIMPMQQQRRCTEGCGRPVCIGNASLTKY